MGSEMCIRDRSSISQGLPILPVVRSLVVNPNRPSTVYLTLSQGLFRSIDGGTSWKKIGIDQVGKRQLGIQKQMLSGAIDLSETPNLYSGTSIVVFKLSLKDFKEKSFDN